MGDIEIAIKRCKRLETLLEEDFGAAGRGLHEKVSSVEQVLPDKLVRRLRFIASMRNKLVHEADVDRLEDRRDYERTCDELERELQRLGWRGDEPAGCWINSTAGVVAMLVALLALVGALILLG